MDAVQRLSRSIVIKVLFIIFSIYVVLLPAYSYSQSIIVLNAKSTVTVYNHNICQAKQKAIQKALYKAIQKAMVKMIKNKSKIQQINMFLLQEKTAHFISKYIVMQEFYNKDIYKVIIKAYISKLALVDFLHKVGLLKLNSMKKVSILVMVPVYCYHCYSITIDSTVQNTIIKKMLPQFNIIDRVISTKLADNDRIRAILSGNNKLAVQIGMYYGANVVIVGKVSFRVVPSGLGQGFVTYHVVGVARAIEINTGNILAVYNKSITSLGFINLKGKEKILQNFADQLADYFILKIYNKYNKSIRSVKIIINGLSYINYLKFKRIFLERIPCIKSINSKLFVDQHIIIQVKIKKDVQSFLNELVLKKVKGFKITVISFAKNTLILKVTRQLTS